MKMLHQASLVWGGTISAAACGLGIQILLARNFEPDMYGQIANASALAILVATFAVQGVGDVLMRHNGQTSGRAAFLACATLCAIGLIAAFGWVAISKFERHEPAMLLAFIPFMLIQAVVFGGMISFQLQNHVMGIASWPFMQQGLRLISTGIMVLISAQAILIPITWSIVLIPSAVWAVILLKRTLQPGDQPRILISALPFSLTRMLEFAELQFPIVLAMSMFGPAKAGLCAAAMTCVQGLLLLPIAVFQRLLRPRLHQWANEDPKTLRRNTIAGSACMFLAGTAFSAIIWPFAEPLLKLIFGSGFEAAGELLRVLLIAVPIWFAAISMQAALVSGRNALARLPLQGIGFLLLVSIVFFTASDSGLTSIGWAVLSSQSFLLAASFVLLMLPAQANQPSTRI